MLVLSRRENERLFIGSDVVVTVLDIVGTGTRAKVRIGITAPPDVTILREEVALRAAIAAGRDAD